MQLLESPAGGLLGLRTALDGPCKSGDRSGESRVTSQSGDLAACWDMEDWRLCQEQLYGRQGQTKGLKLLLGATMKQ